MPRWEVVCAAKTAFGESPNWDSRTGSLVWVDIFGEAAHVFDTTVGAHRSWATGPVTAILPRRADGFALLTEAGLALVAEGEPVTDLALELEPDGAFALNDACCDNEGRLWAAAVGPAGGPPQASIWCVDETLTAKRVARSVDHGNGLALSPDGTVLYHADSRKGLIEAYPFNSAAPGLGAPRAFANVAAADGLPDGLAVDTEGGVWLVLYRGHLSDGRAGSELRRYDPEGGLAEVIDLPVRCSTSCAFGGADLRTLFVTSGSWDAAASERRIAGCLLAIDPGVAGLPVAPFAG